jgi:predicted dehydrogenase
MERRADRVKARPLTVGLIGAGAVGRLHAAAIGRSPESWSLTAVADPDRRNAVGTAVAHGAAACDSADELLALSACDAVVIASPHQEHEWQALAAARAGVHVLLEKPMAPTAAAATTILDACAAAGVVLAVGHLQRYLPAVALAHELIAAGRIGRPTFVSLRRSGRYEAGTRPDWFLDPARAAHGIATNIAPHCIDRLQFLSGAEVEHVSASWHGRPGGVPTEVGAQLWLSSGLTAGLGLVGTGLPDEDVTDVVGTDAALRVSVREGLGVYDRGALVEAHPWPADSVERAFDAQLADFHDAIAAGTEAVVGGEWGVRIARTVDALALSAAAGEPVVVRVPGGDLPA